MKIHKLHIAQVVRIDVLGGAGNSKTISVTEQNVAEVARWIKNLFKDKKVEISPLERIRKIRIQCYEAKSQKKGKYSTMTMYGVTADWIYDNIIENLESADEN